jgi:prepilin-type processing-associated H-X9-DG protein/prepilin-type N-terminal cleavage/methylation domain-containing protein
LNRRAFTLIEILVIIAIIAIVAAILYPVFAKAREKGRQISCLSNFKQCGLAFSQYASDWEGRLPPLWLIDTAGSETEVGTGIGSWATCIMPYLGEGTQVDMTNYDNAYLVGTKFMRCPSAPTPGYTLYGGLDNLYTIGVNYPGAFSYVLRYWLPRSAILDKLPTTTFIAADCSGLRYCHGFIYTPGEPDFTLATDTDNDGIPDTMTGPNQFDVQGPHYYPYNGVAFRHNDGANMLFADGHAKWVARKSWLSNVDQVWGSTADSTVYQ